VEVDDGDDDDGDGRDGGGEASNYGRCGWELMFDEQGSGTIAECCDAEDQKEKLDPYCRVCNGDYTTVISEYYQKLKQISHW
jgi:Zn finger protein HypA/HybF involved in hydrogenase expression